MTDDHYKMQSLYLSFWLSLIVNTQGRSSFFLVASSHLYLGLKVEGFPGSSAGKESACNTGDADMIPLGKQEDPLEKG